MASASQDSSVQDNQRASMALSTTLPGDVLQGQEPGARGR